jgi:hypothetical protein
MESEFDQYEFENYLTDEFFSGNELSEIKKLIKDRLSNDAEFAENYELWLEEVGYDSWKDFYQLLQDEEDISWENMFPDGDDDDSITDYLTKE